MLSRRNFLKISSIVIGLIASGLFFKVSRNKKVRHILASASHERFALSISLYKKASKLDLILDGQNIVKGMQVDKKGTNWKFISDKLLSNQSYELQLISDDRPIYKPWKIKTFPSPNLDVENVSFMSFTCAGGPEGFRSSGKEFFKPIKFRQKVFAEGLSKKPDFAISIGDHIYWDLRGESSPPVGRNNKFIKFFLGSYISLVYGKFNRLESASSSTNEKVLKKLGNEQIASLYGTKFKSTPIFFIPDDHDYFENDDAEEQLVTFPADKFSKDVFKKWLTCFIHLY